MQYYNDYTEYKRAKRKRIIGQIRFNCLFIGVWAVLALVALLSG